MPDFTPTSAFRLQYRYPSPPPRLKVLCLQGIHEATSGQLAAVKALGFMR